MGILNTTPDSFYDGGKFQARDRAIARAIEMVDEGADILDIGGEKAGPGQAVPVEVEIERVVPLIEAVRHEVPVPISVDTWKPAVARAATAAGAGIINSIGGFDDHAMGEVATTSGAAIVVMHIKGAPRVANPTPQYTDVVAEVQEWLAERVRACLGAGIASERIVVDPGPGFGKTSYHDLRLIRALREFTCGPFPVMLAASRKPFIGDVLDLGVEERLEGSLAVVAWAVLQGARIVRVHDVRASKRVAAMTEAVLRPALVGGER